MTADPRAKALAILRSGRLTIVESNANVGRVFALVRTSRPDSRREYTVDRWGHSGKWECTCQPNGSVTDCAHIAAARLVTDHGVAG